MLLGKPNLTCYLSAADCNWIFHVSSDGPFIRNIACPSYGWLCPVEPVARSREK